ncbi:MAG: DUF6163 family protein [Candidatus Limnocylindria bacterium]
MTEMARRAWSWLLRLLAILYAYSAAVHAANLLGIGARGPGQVPLHWTIADVAFVVLDSVAAIGLWRARWWGIAAFLLAVGAQLIMYLFFPTAFSETEVQRRALNGIVVAHLFTIMVFGTLWFLKTDPRPRRAPPPPPPD